MRLWFLIETDGIFGAMSVYQRIDSFVVFFVWNLIDYLGWVHSGTWLSVQFMATKLLTENTTNESTFTSKSGLTDS